MALVVSALRFVDRVLHGPVNNQPAHPAPTGAEFDADWQATPVGRQVMVACQPHPDRPTVGADR
jgi:hypothetical protein